MSDTPSENHDGNTQPLPAGMGAGVPTEPLVPEAFETEPIAKPIAPVITHPKTPSWVPWVILGLVLVAGALLGAMLLPQLLAPTVTESPSPSPTITLPSATPTDDDDAPPAEEPPAEPEPQPSAPEPEPTEEQPPSPEPTP